jgi:formylglycine-generating enzyme required for sulfatase activity
MRTAGCVPILAACLSTLAMIPPIASAQTPPGADRRMPGEITNSIGMKMVLIPAGEFLMGAKLSVEEVYEQFPGGPKEPRITRPSTHGTRFASRDGSIWVRMK